MNFPQFAKVHLVKPQHTTTAFTCTFLTEHILNCVNIGSHVQETTALPFSPSAKHLASSPPSSHLPSYCSATTKLRLPAFLIHSLCLSLPLSTRTLVKMFHFLMLPGCFLNSSYNQHRNLLLIFGYSLPTTSFQQAAQFIYVFCNHH